MTLNRILIYAGLSFFCMGVTAAKSNPQTPVTQPSPCDPFLNVAKYSRALEICQADPQQGVARASMYLAAAYYDGVNSKRNFSEAHSWALRAQEAHLSDADFLLGLMMVNGQGVPRDIEKGLALLERAGNQQNSHALEMLYHLYETHPQWKPKRPDTLTYLMESAELGNIRAQMTLASTAHFALVGPVKHLKRDWKQLVLRSLQRWQASGATDPELYLGWQHLSFQMGHYDPRQDTLDGANQANHQDEMVYTGLGSLFAGNRIDLEDGQEALRWFQKAAQVEVNSVQGSAHVQICQIYLYGKKNVPVDFEKALSACQFAAWQGDDFASILLANLYLRRRAPGDQDRAIRVLQPLADQNHGLAMLNLAELYLVRYPDWQRDPARAVHWLRKLIALNQKYHSIDAMYRLGSQYYWGDGVKRSPHLAEHWWKKAAPESTLAVIDLFLLYLQGMDFDGLGFPASPDKAAALCRRYQSNLQVQLSIKSFLKDRKNLNPVLVEACL